VDRNSLALYDYYLATGYEPAGTPCSRRSTTSTGFDRIRRHFLPERRRPALTVAYRWTQSPDTCAWVNQLVASGLEDVFTGGGLHLTCTRRSDACRSACWRRSGRPLPPFPLLEYTNETESSVLSGDRSGQPLEIRLFVQMSGESEPTSATWLKARHERPAQDRVRTKRKPRSSPSGRRVRAARSPACGWRRGNASLSAGPACSSDDPRRYADGLYALTVPGPAVWSSQETEAAELGMVAPEGFRVAATACPTIFSFPKSSTSCGSS